MPLPTHADIVKICGDLTFLSNQMEHMRRMEESSQGEIAVAYKKIADDFAFRLLKRINELWLYMNDSVSTITPPFSG